MVNFSTSSDEIVSVAEAADIIGVSEGRIRVLLAQGRIEARKLNQRAWAISRQSLEAFSRLERPVGNPNFRKL